MKGICLMLIMPVSEHRLSNTAEPLYIYEGNMATRDMYLAKDGWHHESLDAPRERT
jgi:hypothetical protein